MHGPAAASVVPSMTKLYGMTISDSSCVALKQNDVSLARTFDTAMHESQCHLATNAYLRVVDYLYFRRFQLLSLCVVTVLSMM
jgi:hypothetical protein